MAESTTGGEWSKKADTLRSSVPANQVSEPLAGAKVNWSKLDNTMRPSGNWR